MSDPQVDWKKVRKMVKKCAKVSKKCAKMHKKCAFLHTFLHPPACLVLCGQLVCRISGRLKT